MRHALKLLEGLIQKQKNSSNTSRSANKLINLTSGVAFFSTISIDLESLAFADIYVTPLAG